MHATFQLKKTTKLPNFKHPPKSLRRKIIHETNNKKSYIIIDVQKHLFNMQRCINNNG